MAKQKVSFKLTTRLTLRDYFAGQALVGLSGYTFHGWWYRLFHRAYTSQHLRHEWAADFAYKYADAMLAERKKIDNPLQPRKPIS